LATLRQYAPLTQNDELLVRGNAAAQAAFWTIDDPVARTLQRMGELIAKKLFNTPDPLFGAPPV
jgi:hypothetical protein